MASFEMKPEMTSVCNSKLNNYCSIGDETGREIYIDHAIPREFETLAMEIFIKAYNTGFRHGNNAGQRELRRDIKNLLGVIDP